jgi:hypothetical protein
MKVPNFLAVHPAESVMAAFLLLGLLFISADGSNQMPSQTPLQVATEKN